MNNKQNAKLALILLFKRIMIKIEVILKGTMRMM